MTYGLKGWFWEMRDGNYGVVITDHRVLNKYFNPHKDYQYPPGAEDVRYLTPSEFDSHRIPRLIQVLPDKQRELSDWHDSKASATPKSRPAVT